MIRLQFIAMGILCMLLSYNCYAGTRTWKGTNNSDWNNSGNWSPAITPSDGDDLVFDQSGINTNIQSIPSIRINSLIVQSNGPAVSYSFSSGPHRTLSFSGTTNCFSIGNNCSLTISNSLSTDMGTWGSLSSMKVKGNLTINGDITFEWSAGNLVIDSTASATMNGNVTYNSSFGLFKVDGLMQINGTFIIPPSDAQLEIGATGNLNVNKPFIFKSSGNINVHGHLNFSDSFTVTFTSAKLNINPGGSMAVTGNFLYQSSGNINCHGNMSCNSMEIPWTNSQIVISDSGSFTINGPFTYHSTSDFIVNGNGVFHINDTYTSNSIHRISGTGKVSVDAGEILTIFTNLTIDTDLYVYGRLSIPNNRTLNVNGSIKIYNQSM